MEVFNLLQAGPAGGGIVTIVMLIGMFAVMYFLIIRPQNKERKKLQQMISELKKGDKVVTIGGIYGTVSSVKEQSVILKVDDTCKIEMSKSAVSSVLNAKVNSSNEKTTSSVAESSDSDKKAEKDKK